MAETEVDVVEIAASLLEAFEQGNAISPITSRIEGFDLDDAYAVLREIARVRTERGWTRVGRKIGFTNTTIWELFGVEAPMWADVWSETVSDAAGHAGTVEIGNMQEVRIEPEVVFKLADAPVPTDDPDAILGCVEWMAPGFEIVQCIFPGWRFALPDATAAFGLHGRLVVGEPVAITNENRGALVQTLADFELTLSRDGEVADTGVGANVLGSPARALGHLASVVAADAAHRPLAAGEIITTGTVTNALPVAPGERWSSDYGALGLEGLTVSFE